MKKIFVRDIFCNHFAPKTKEEFIYTFYKRSNFCRLCKKFANKSLFSCFFRTAVKFLLVLYEFFMPIKVIRKSLGMIKFTDKKSRFFVFYFLYFLKSICFVFGEFNTFLKYMFGKYT